MVEIVQAHDLYVIPIAMGLAEYLKRCLGVSSKLMPLVVIGFCGLGDLALAKIMGQPVNGMTLLGGIVAGFVATGLYSAQKNVRQFPNGGAG